MKCRKRHRRRRRRNSFADANCRKFVPTPKLGYAAIRRRNGPIQGCQMVYFLTKKSNLGKFWSVLKGNLLIYFMAIWSILRPNCIFYCNMVNFVVVWYIFPRFGLFYQVKSGNPGPIGFPSLKMQLKSFRPEA
jgi:hypothetical protein